MKTYRQFKQSEGIAGTRTRLGFTQADLAQHLGISHSLLQKAEYGQRTLPVQSLAKLASLEVLMAADTTSTPEVKPHPAEVENSYLNEHSPNVYQLKELHCRETILHLECKLALMEARYTQTRQTLDWVERMIDSGVGSQSPFGTIQLEIHRAELCRRLSKCSQPAQAHLRHRIGLLRAAAEMHKSLQQQYQ
jgi:transcriptional regulator with XRE-family HTH domain